MAHTTSLRDDILTSGERYLTTPREPIAQAQMHFQVQGQRLTYDGPALPKWVEPTIRSLEERWAGVDGWDGYDGKPTDLRCATQLLNYLLLVLRNDSTPPLVTPLADGGLQAEWYKANVDLEIVVPANEPARYYFCDPSLGSDEASELTSDFSRLRKLVARF